MNTEIQKQFVSFEIAVKLKSLGFDEPCIAEYYGDLLTFYCNTQSYHNGHNEILNLKTYKNTFLNHLEEKITYSAPLWTQVIAYINDFLCENGQTKRIYFFDNIQAERDILKELELIEKQK